MPGFSPVIPLQLDDSDGFALTQTYQEVAKQNLKTLILTNPGERVMLPFFGVGIRKKLFDPKTPYVYDSIDAEIRNQVASYLPYIRIVNILVDDLKNTYSNEEIVNSISVRVIYYVDSLNISDELQILISI